MKLSTREPPGLLISENALIGELLAKKLQSYGGTIVVEVMKVPSSIISVKAYRFVILDTLARDWDVLSWTLRNFTSFEITPLIVLASYKTPWLITSLCRLNQVSIVDPNSCSVEEIRVAIESGLKGVRYMSIQIAEFLKWLNGDNTAPKIGLLTPFEEQVFSVIGGGLDDVRAAEILNLRPSTVQSTRRVIHQKLGLKHRGDLIRAAVQQGYVMFSSKGVLRPGFEVDPKRWTGRIVNPNSK